MSRLLVVACILASGQIISALFVDETLLANCRANNNTPLSNDFFLGEWFEVTRFSWSGGFPPSMTCTSNVYTKATAENVTAYINNYHNPTPSMDDNPVLVSRDNGKFAYLLTGPTEAKDYYVQPGMYALSHTVNNYRRLNDDYVLVWDCQMRGNIMVLHSRVNHPTAEELAAVTANVPELQGLQSQRFCAS